MLADFTDRFSPAPSVAIASSSGLPGRTRQFTGEYQQNTFGGSETTVEKARRILGEGNRPVVDRGDGMLTIEGIEGSARFVEIAPDLFRSVEGTELVLVQRNERGEVIRTSFSGSPVYTNDRLSLFETPGLNLALLIATAGLFGSSLVATAGAWITGGPQAADSDRFGCGARWAAGLVAATTIIFLAGLLAVGGDPATLAGDFTRLRRLFVLPLLSILLTALAVIYAALAWRGRGWSLPRRLHYTALALASVAFVWFLGTGNLLGFQF